MGRTWSDDHGVFVFCIWSSISASVFLAVSGTICWRKAGGVGSWHLTRGRCRGEAMGRINQFHIQCAEAPQNIDPKAGLRRESSLESEALPARNCWSSMFLHGSVDDQTCSLVKYALAILSSFLTSEIDGNCRRNAVEICGALIHWVVKKDEKRSCLMWAQWAAWIPGADECAYTIPFRRCCRCWQMMGSISKALPFLTPNAGTCQD